MTIKREDVDAGRVDFGDVATGKRVRESHPGEILRHEFLEPIAVSVYALANAIKVPRSRINDIVRGRRSVSPDTTLRLGLYFGTSPEFWSNLQSHYDMELAKRTLLRRVEKEVSPRAA